MHQLLCHSAMTICYSVLMTAEQHKGGLNPEFAGKVSIERIRTSLEGINRESIVAFEVILDKAGLLTALEEIGVLPAIEIPNPYHQEHEAEQNEQWWTDHPTESEQFVAAFDERDTILRYLLMGAIIDRAIEQ